MKKYLLFAGSQYYPSGGWNDFKGDFDSIHDAREAAKLIKWDWAHVVNTDTVKSLGQIELFYGSL